MTRLEWDSPIARDFKAGVDQAVLYPRDAAPVVWNGIVSVDESPDDVAQSKAYYDGSAYVQQVTREGFTAKVQAVTFPEILDTGGEFDFSYRVETDEGWDIHLVYNAKFAPSDVSYETIDDGANISLFEWMLTTVPEKIAGVSPTAHVIINTGATEPDIMLIVSNLLYGTDGDQARIPHLPELRDMFEIMAAFVVTDNGDGTWTATGPDDMIEMVDSTTFQITSPSVVVLDSVTYRLSSW